MSKSLRVDPKSRHSILRAGAFVALCLLLAAGAAVAQLQTGDLFGRTTDAAGQPLPGVTITLSGVGADQVQVTDDNGRFRFLGLYPGSYALLAELQGFGSVEAENVAVRVGGNAEMLLTLSTASVAETITVTGERPLLDERQTNRGASLPAEVLDQVSTARDPWSLLSQTPGVLVDRFNIGGNESGQQSAFLGAGSGSRENVFAVDGVVLTDMNAVGASATYFDFGAFEEVQMTTSSTDVTVATAGVTINQVTKRGTNEWRGQARYLVAEGSWQSEAPTVGDFKGNEIDSVEEYGADVGGPIVRERAWIWGSYGESDIRNIAIGGQLDTTQLEDLNTKVNFQATESWSGVAHYWTNDKLKFGRGAGPSRAPGSTLDQTTPQDIYKIETSVVPRSNFYLTALWARDDGIFTLSPQGGLGVQGFVDENGVRQNTYFDFLQEAVIDQGRVDASYFFDTGSVNHELKFGAGFRSQENESGTVWPQNRVVVAGETFGDDEFEQVIFPRNRQVSFESTYDSAWIQDTISVDRWTINAGVRYDLQKGENRATQAAANPLLPDLLPALNFPGNDAGGFEWESLVPRLGVTYAAGAERDTLFRASFSQYAEQLGQLPLLSRVNPLGYQYAYFYFIDSNSNLIFDPNEAPSLIYGYVYNINGENPSSLVTPNVNDPNLDPVMSSEVTLGVEHSFLPELVGGVTLTYRQVTDIPEERFFVLDESTGKVRLLTRDDWEPAGLVCVPEDECAPLPNGQAVTPRQNFDVKPGLTPTGGSFYTNGDREQEYTGLTVSLNKRMANRWSLRGHFTWMDWNWKIGDEFRKYDDPADTLTDTLGYSDGEDTFFEQSGGNKGDVFVGGNWTFGINGIYQVAPDRPWGFNVGLSIDGRQGYISPPNVRIGSAIGRRRIQLTNDIDEFRLDDVTVFSAHVDKEIKIGETRLTLALDGFNLTNEDTVLQRERNLFAGRANEVNEILSPRIFRVGATIRFR